MLRIIIVATVLAVIVPATAQENGSTHPPKGSGTDERIALLEKEMYRYYSSS